MTCKAKIIVGGGKAAKRRGEKFAKWHCPECNWSGWMNQDPRTACEETTRIVNTHKSAQKEDTST